jgi:hypothetical protein
MVAREAATSAINAWALPCMLTVPGGEHRKIRLVDDLNPQALFVTGDKT